MATVTDPRVWQGEEGAGTKSAQTGSDFVSVSNLHEASFAAEKERRGRKRPHPSDPEL